MDLMGNLGKVKIKSRVIGCIFGNNDLVYVLIKSWGSMFMCTYTRVFMVR